MSELIRERLRRLRVERGMSMADLSHETVRLGLDPVSVQVIQLLESKPGRVPAAGTIEALAAALSVQPEEFHEYPIAVARRQAEDDPKAVRRREEDKLRKRAARSRKAS